MSLMADADHRRRYLKVGGTVKMSGGVPEKHPGVSMVLPFTTGPALIAGGA